MHPLLLQPIHSSWFLKCAIAAELTRKHEIQCLVAWNMCTQHMQGCAAGLSFLVDVLAATNTQHHHVASLGTDAGPVKPSNVPLMLGFPLYEP
eukprot:scaffold116204_cov36-Tisochrysis_lutea.AAC.5